MNQPTTFELAQIAAALANGQPLTGVTAPKPSKYPVPLDEFLRLTVGGKYKGDRLYIYREFLRKSGIIEPPPDLNKVAAIIAKQRKHGIPEQDYSHLCHELKRWLKERQQEKAPRRQEQCRQAAKKRWSQERRKRALTKKFERRPLT